MNLVTYSNLYPRPDQPQRGVFNRYLFGALQARLEPGSGLRNFCPVSEIRPWRLARAAIWRDPSGAPFATQYLPVPHVPLLSRNLGWRLHARALRCALHGGNADAVLAAWLYPDGVGAVYGLRDCPVWILVQGSDTFHLDHPVRGARIREACRRVAGVFCVAANLAGRFEQAGLPADRIEVVPNGVDATRFRFRERMSCRERLAAAPGNAAASSRLKDASLRMALYVGNLAPIKGPDLLLEAWERLSALSREPGANRMLVVIGEGPLKKRLQRRARGATPAGTVWFAGARSHAELPLWMNAADCLCLSSRGEGMPNAVIEALCSGLPVAAFDVGDCRNMLAGEPAARLVPSGDCDSMALALDALLRDRADRGALARRHALRYSWDRQAARILERMQRIGVAGPGTGRT